MLKWVIRMKQDIELLISNHRYKEVRSKLSEMNESDVASIIEELPEQDLIRVFRLLPKDIAADVFSYIDVEIQQKLITSLSDVEAVDIINNMYSDDAADLLDEMPAGIVTKLLKKVSPETRRAINLLLNYPDNSAGSIMSVDFIALKEEMNIEEAINRIKRDGEDKEAIETCFVIDNNRHLKGTISLRKIILSNKEDYIKNIMEENAIKVKTLDDQEEVAKLFQKYDFTSLAVVDSENRLVGIVTVDDIVDVIQEETTEDIEKMAAITPSDKPYMKTGVIEIWKKRIPWLLLLMISATFTGKIIQRYEVALSAYVVLTAFIPMIMDTGGNAGGQASATIIRGLSLNEITYKDSFKIVWKELRIAILSGLVLAVANFFKLLYIDSVSINVVFVVCLTLVLTVMIAKLVGSMLPILAKKIGFDPAVMASPFITTIVDAISLFIYFQIAVALLHI